MSFSVHMVPVSRSSTYVMDILIASMDLMNTTVQLVRVDCRFKGRRDWATYNYILFLSSLLIFNLYIPISFHNIQPV